MSWIFAIFDIIIFGGQTIAQQPMGNVFTILVLLPSISLGARRLHDINRSGWWLLLWCTIIGIIPLLYWACKPGDNQQNDYGPDFEAGKET
ncbi:hypothetical protein GCM10017044_24180 [Kordiimonas sediminis]|uniref:DUF805 domain-containing protein n=1 Tax=Kordiimonas sediminis TaxID=1735581 RepID=A0A919AVX5_9PROT|nr:hypothetical protein GCM10017044_24180 [Kordiimonas sediminis]